MAERAIRAYANCDDAYVAWRYEKPIPESRGFALFRSREGSEPEPVDTWVPFVGETPKSGEFRPSTEWPIQKFMWSDFGVRSGDQVRYRVVPMVGKSGSLEPAEEEATDWTEPLDVTPDAEAGMAAYFNRGVLATQSVARRLGPDAGRKKLGEIITKPGDPTRNYLAGDLREAMIQLLEDVKAGGKTLLAALFELDDPELLEGLKGLGGRARVVLANGADRDDENSDAREALKTAGVEVHDRMTGSRLAHNKYVVVCDAKGQPERVWTGSTNWTDTGLCTQVNNGLRIDNVDVAGWYAEHWQALCKAESEFPDWLVTEDAEPHAGALGEGQATTWFPPMHDVVDLDDARARIANAKRGILFLMFNPGREGTLLNAIMDRASEPLYIHGVLNQDPEAGSDDPALVGLIHRGELDAANPDIVLPSSVDERFANWEPEIRSYSIVMVHSKVVVLDPFGEEPVVMTGSHNMGPRASGSNDENLIIIEGAPRLAAAYAVNVMAIYNAYRWRYVRSQEAKEAGNAWEGLVDGSAWQDGYFTEPKQRELGFWLGE
jgi:hypothetical protein